MAEAEDPLDKVSFLSFIKRLSI